MNIDKRLLHWARQSRFTLILTVGLGCAAGVLTVAQADSLSRVIDLVYLGGQSLGQVNGLLIALLVFILLRALLAWGSELSANAMALRLKSGLRQRLIRHILCLGPAYTSQERTGELTNAAVEGIEALDAYFSQYLPGLVLAALVPVTYLAFVFPLDTLSGFVLLLTAPLIPVFMILIGSLSQALTRQRWQSLSRMSAYFLDLLQGLTTLKLLGRSQEQVEVIAQVSDNFRRTTMSVLQVTFLSALVLEMVATLSTAVVAVEVGLRLLYGRLAFQQALLVLLLAPEFYLPLRLLGTRFHAGMSGMAAAKRIFEILELPVKGAETSLRLSDQRPESGDENGTEASPLPTLSSPAIQFKRVKFSYGDERQALHGVSFQIRGGQKVALVGPSGGGKSTIAALLLHFIEPTQGLITADGRLLSEISATEWRSRVAWVSQRPYLFHDTVLANVRLARPQATLEQVIWAAKQAEAHDFIQALPQGYNTLVGERGARLSGGEAQRIVLARAFLKDAPLVILDEATANLDPENEDRIQQAMQRLLQGRTALIIAHRMNTVREADQVIVLERGKVVESGMPLELLLQGGLYQDLMEAFTAEAAYEGAFSEEELRNPLAAILPPEIPPAVIPSEPSPGPLPPPIFTVSEPTGLTASRRPFLRLLGFLMPFKGWLTLSVLTGLATVLSGVGLMTASAYIISAAALHPSIADLQIAIVGVRFFGIARGVFRYLERCLSHQTTFRLLASLRIWFYQALEPLAPARLMSYRSGDLLARILADIESLENFYVRTVAPPLTAALVSVVIYAFLSCFDLCLAMVWLAFLALAGVGVPTIIRGLSKDVGRELVAQRASLNAAVVDCIQGMPDLFACNQEERQVQQIDHLGQALASSQRRMASISGLQTASSSLLANLGMWAVLALAIPLVQSGRLEGVYLAVLTLAALTGFEAVAPLPLAAQYLESNLQAARRLFEVVDARPEVQDPVDPLPLPGRFDLEVKSLSFRYPPLARSLPHIMTDRVLKEVSFSLPGGKRLAIVGPSGAGKSTLVNLLLRFWEFEVGQILLAEQDLRSYAQDDLRRCISVVSQNTYLFSASVRDNLRMAQPNATEAEIVCAAKQAQIHDFIQSLPEGYDTWVGEQGLRLSAGERQRLAIARALLKNAPILVLDEATANLDAVTEREVLRSIYTAIKGRTTLIVAHRLAGMESIDEILVLDKGMVVERGPHAELMKNGGLYRRMWDLLS